MRQQIITGLDLGTSHIRIAVGQKNEQNAGKLQIIGLTEFPSQGIIRGSISSIDDTVSSITAALEQSEKITGLPIEQVFFGISGPSISCQEGKGVIAVSKINGEIEEEDVRRAIEAAHSVNTPPNHEMLHIIPKNFIVDGQSAIKDPVGMTGIRLEAETLVINGSSSQIKNFTKCVYRTGLHIEDIVYSGLAVSEAALSNKQKELGVAVLDIGASTTHLTVFEGGDLIHSATLPLGSDHITADIAIGLRIDLETAEKIKVKEGYALSSEIDKKVEIELKDFGEEESALVSKKYLTRIIEARVEEILERVDNEFKKIGKSGMLPAGVILTGGGAKLKGIVEQVKKQLRLPARLAQIEKITSVLDKAFDLSFCTAIGLVIWGSQTREGEDDKGFSMREFKKIFRKLGNWVKNLKP